MGRSTSYILGFAAAICLVCSVIVAGAAVSLKDRQEINKQLDQKKKVLIVANLMEDGEDIEAAEVDSRFAANITAQVIDLKTGDVVELTDVELLAFDQRKARQDMKRSIDAPAGNPAGVKRLPNHAKIFLVTKDGAVDRIILPIEGKGLWSTLYGFIALEKNTHTVAGIVFYEHGETPGLGGEIDNLKWKKGWVGREAFEKVGDNSYSLTPVIDVIKGQAGSVQDAPHKIDGLSGATITGRGVGHLVRFWLGDDGFSAYLTKFRAGGSV